MNKQLTFEKFSSLSFVSLHVQRAADMAIGTNDLVSKAEDIADQVRIYLWLRSIQIISVFSHVFVK